MLSVNSPRPAEIIKAFDGKIIEGIHFEVEGRQGLSVILRHDSTDDQAKKVCKAVMAQLPSLKQMVCSCQIINPDGKLV